MRKPDLTFFCELETAPLLALFSLPDMVTLADLEASVSLGILDLSSERAELVRRLNKAKIPLIAWLLLPKEQGYWFNLDNADQACERYEAFKSWTDENGLVWERIGLDIEPDIRLFEQLSQNKWRVFPTMATKLFDRRRFIKARETYRNLVRQIRTDGYKVDSYQFPLIVDERAAGSTLIQRLGGIVDLQVDREVLMLYSSFLRPKGPGVIWSYGRQAGSIAIGSTGGGVEVGSLNHRALSWEELARDLRLAWVFTHDIHIFSLEGCVKEGYLTRLKNFVWDQPIFDPIAMAEQVNHLRRSFRIFLWISARMKTILVGAGVGFLVARGLKRKFNL
jgi:hypothetical protein